MQFDRDADDVAFAVDRLDDLRSARIIAAGHRIGHAYALSAMTFTDGQISLDNGVHRWAVATELGIKRVPVEMNYQSPKPAWEWSWR